MKLAICLSFMIASQRTKKIQKTEPKQAKKPPPNNFPGANDQKKERI